MKQIIPPIDAAAKICGKQIEKPGDYRYTTHCMQLACLDGILLYQTLTGEMLLIESGESAEQHRSELIQKRFLVPVSYDEQQYLAQFRHLMALFHKEDGISAYMIFTTLDCNARCYYCYELGSARPVMSVETARAVSAYILQNHGQGNVKLHWFGGEPLFNRQVIDIITDALRENGVAFTSTMISNGYLFDEETVHTAHEKWNLKLVQITLDGTEEVYNHSKAYIYREGSPYRRVLRNIGLLLNAGVQVRIRMNLGRDNATDLLTLCGELDRTFPDKKNLRAYAALLKDYGNVRMDLGEEALRFEAYKTLCARLRELKLSGSKLPGRFALNHCCADHDGSVGILPDGYITRCEHETEERVFGSICAELPAAEEHKKWKERIAVPACAGCVHAPLCTELKHCPGTDGTCTELDRMQKDMRLRESMLYTYETVKNRAAAPSLQEDDGAGELC